MNKTSSQSHAQSTLLLLPLSSSSIGGAEVAVRNLFINEQKSSRGICGRDGLDVETASSQYCMQ